MPSASAAGHMASKSGVARQKVYEATASGLFPAFQVVARLAELGAKTHVHPLLAVPQIEEANTKAKLGAALLAPFLHPYLAGCRIFQC
jgi:hypothetical protein